MSLTQSQIDANRANAQNSTGPVSPEGKQRSSQNAVRHGLTGQTIVLPSEDIEAYNAFCRRWFNDLQPKGVREECLVQQMADCQWVVSRAQSYLQCLETPDPGTGDALSKATAEFAKITRYRAQWVREFNNAMKMLAELQTARRAQEAADLEEAIEAYKLHKMLEQPFDPAELGFVSSIDQILAAIRKSERLNMTEIARAHGFNRKKYFAATAAA